jgi:hypothetical protein
MLFSVFYSADVPAGGRIRDYEPAQAGSLWTKTGSGPTEYAYLEGRWEQGRHGQWSALLNRRQFDEFVDALGLYAEDVQTMGSLGAPGFGFGWSPAISFTSDDPDAILNAYVTPIPECRKQRFDDRDWERLRRVVLSIYGRGRVRAAA